VDSTQNAFFKRMKNHQPFHEIKEKIDKKLKESTENLILFFATAANKENLTSKIIEILPFGRWWLVQIVASSDIY
jgi:hypothetical protein